MGGATPANGVPNGAGRTKKSATPEPTAPASRSRRPPSGGRHATNCDGSWNSMPNASATPG
jgi:hypothetical protein